jgi:predicted nucleotidyltransferase
MLLADARADDRVTGAALTGSAARHAEDRWSDIDLYLGLARDADTAAVVADWTGRIYAAHGAVHHTDVYRGSTLYRVFLLASTLQVDIAFAAAAEFGPTGPAFRLVFGTQVDKPLTPLPAPVDLIGTAWLYALHARSSIARGRVWQAEYMISGMRDEILALACLRAGVSPYQGRGMDQLPAEATAIAGGALVRSLEPAELRRAFTAATDALLAEARMADAALSARLASPLADLVSSCA